MKTTPLVCPSCGRPHPEQERFCGACGLPLIETGRGADSERADSEAHARARKIKPELSRGELVKVGWGRNQAEAEMIQMLLLEEGIPTTLRRSAGFDVPDFLAAGPRDVLAPQSGAQAARELLGEADRAAPSRASERNRATRLLAGLLAALLVLGLVSWVLYQLTA